MKYTSQQYMVMVIAFGGAIAIFPFALYRLLVGDWLMAAVDGCMVAGMLVVGVVTYRSHNIDTSGVILSIIGLVGMTSVVYIKGPLLIFWAYPTMVALYFILTPVRAITLTLITTFVLSITLYLNMPLLEFVAVLMTLLVNNIFAFLFANQMKTQSDRLYQLVRKDSLTGVGNRRALDEKIEEMVALHKRTGEVFSIVILDADHFKKVNDKYGHSAGDNVLIKLASIIQHRIRCTDGLYRYGGEEFVALLLATKVDSALAIAEEFRQLIESTALIEGHKVTISQGIAEYVTNESADSFFQRADEALYAAKESGRNRSCIAKDGVAA